MPSEQAVHSAKLLVSAIKDRWLSHPLCTGKFQGCDASQIYMVMEAQQVRSLPPLYTEFLMTFGVLMVV